MTLGASARGLIPRDLPRARSRPTWIDGDCVFEPSAHLIGSLGRIPRLFHFLARRWWAVTRQGLIPAGARLLKSEPYVPQRTEINPSARAHRPMI